MAQPMFVKHHGGVKNAESVIFTNEGRLTSLDMGFSGKETCRKG